MKSLRVFSMRKPLHLLSTMPLPEAFIQAAATQKVVIDNKEFIKTIPVTSENIRAAVEQVSNKAATVIFTSQQAVNAVSKLVQGHLVNWTIFCTGGATHELVTRYFTNSRIAGMANDAERLAGKIIAADDQRDLVFFCGNQRREALPAKLASLQIKLEEVPVYETVATPEIITPFYQGILFYSPSGAESFFSLNAINSSTVLFAIGSTTAASLRQFSTNTIITGREPGKRALAEQAIEYFDT